MTTRAEALDAVITSLRKDNKHHYSSEYQNVAEIVVDKLIAYGIHPNAIKVAFTTEVKKDVGQSNEGQR